MPTHVTNINRTVKLCLGMQWGRGGGGGGEGSTVPNCVWACSGGVRQSRTVSGHAGGKFNSPKQDVDITGSELCLGPFAHQG